MNERQQAVAYRLIGILEDAHRDCECDRLIEAEENDRLTHRRCQVCTLLEEFNEAAPKCNCTIMGTANCAARRTPYCLANPVQE